MNCIALIELLNDLHPLINHREIESITTYYNGVMFEVGRTKYFYNYGTEEFEKHPLTWEP